MHPPSGVVEKLVRRGIEPKSQVAIVFTGPFQNDEMHRVVVRAMAATLAGDLQGGGDARIWYMQTSHGGDPDAWTVRFRSSNDGGLVRTIAVSVAHGPRQLRQESQLINRL
jgi:hypothetical protein